MEAPPGGTSYTLSQTARACLQALRLAAWIEAMSLAYRAVEPHGAAAWSWLIVRCVLFTLGAHIVVGVAAQLARRRGARGAGAAEAVFDTQAFEHTASALLFHAGPPLWMWIFT
jgi:hypothetical protein